MINGFAPPRPAPPRPQPDAGTGDNLLDLIKTYGEHMRRTGYAEARGDGDTALASYNAAMAALGQVIAARQAGHA